MVTVNIATIPVRSKQLINAVKSLYSQVDRINIWFNDYTTPPKWAIDQKIRYRCSRNIGDAGKFGFNTKGFMLSCDDDIIYPTDYVERMTGAIDGNVITIHGKTFRTPIKSFYHGSDVKIRCDEELVDNTIIHIPGTGVMAWHTDTIQFSRKDFKRKNMADIWAGIKAKNRGIDVVCIAHPPAWVQLQSVDDSIWDRAHLKDYWQTKLINDNF